MPGIALFSDTLFPLKSRPPDVDSPEGILAVFHNALVTHATLSVDLAELIRASAAKLSTDDFKSQEASALFRKILSHDGDAGQMFRQMHDTGVLGKIVPYFEALTCKVEYDSYHEFTIDEHILLTIAHFDGLKSDPNENIRAVYRAIPRKMIMRLGLLLHDIGKALPGDHTVNGAIITETVCERLGLNLDEAERVRSLVHNHLKFHNLSLLREPQESDLRSFAVEVEDRENLDMLYLLTIVDIQCVGHKTFTAWKAFLLEQQHSRVAMLLNKPLTALAQTGEPAAVQTYEHDVLPEDREQLSRMASELEGGDGIRLLSEEFRGFERLAVCGHDQIGFLSNIIGCITSEGYNILSAKVYTIDDETAVDIFYLEPPGQPAISMSKRTDNLYRKWRDLTAGSTTADTLVADRIRTYPPPRLRGASKGEVKITADNESSAVHTIIEIDTPDNFGLLHRIARCMSEHRMNIVSARLSTRIDIAVDVFYVCGAEGVKITNAAVLDSLVNDLKKSLAG
jgi:[protein-PII] uridylyltransferase